MTPKLTIQILGWNSAKELRANLPVLRNIPQDEALIRYIDNGSTDDSVSIVKKYIGRADIVELHSNKGFSAGHNVGFAMCNTPFVLVANPDVALSWSGVIQLMNEFQDPRVAAVQGKLYRPNHGKLMFDSAGIVFTLALNGKDRGAGQLDQGQYDQPSLIDAVTGACGLYRIAALRSIAYNEGGYPEFFDEAFFAYKEDVDIGWRLTNAGYRIRYVPIVMGFHKRSLQLEGDLGWKISTRSILNRIRDTRTRYSMRNYIWMLIKNASAANVLTHMLFITIRVTTLVLVSLLMPSLAKVWLEIVKGMPAMMMKRSIN